LYWECRAGAQINFPESGRSLGHVTPTMFGSTVGYPSDSLASCQYKACTWRTVINSIFYSTPVLLLKLQKINLHVKLWNLRAVKYRSFTVEHCDWLQLVTWMEVNIAETSYVGLHLFCRISRHMLPSAYTATVSSAIHWLMTQQFCIDYIYINVTQPAL